jgi:HK97 family phage major capsid protein
MDKKTLLEGIAYVRACLEAIHGGAEARSLDADEQASWDAGVAYIADAERQVARIDEVARLAKIDTNVESGDAPQIMTRVSAFDGSDVTTLRASEARDKGLKALEIRSGEISDAAAAHVEKLLRTRNSDFDGTEVAKRLLVTESDGYRDAFAKVAVSPGSVLTPEESRAMLAYQEYRAQSTTTTAGGFGVPVLIDPTIIITDQGEPNDILRISRVEQITNNVWKGVSAAGAVWSFDSEAAEVSDDSITLAQPSVTCAMARGFIPFSIEIEGDYPGFSAEFSAVLREGYSSLLASKVTTGSGSGEPKGIVTALDANTNVEVVVTTDGAFGAVDLYKVWDALPAKYRANASFISSTDVQNEARNFGTTMGSNFTVNLTDEAIPRLFGHPYYLNDFMDDFTGTTGAANLLVVGDFRNFLIAQRVGMTVELVPHLLHTSNNRPSGQRGLFAYARVGSNSVNDSAFRILENQ